MVCSLLLQQTSSDLYLPVICACFSLLAVGLLVGAIFLFLRRRKDAGIPRRVELGQPMQDLQDNWWYQDPTTASWYIWNGQIWQHIPGAAPRIAPQESVPESRSAPKFLQSGSCLPTTIVGFLLTIIMVGGISLVALNFFPAYHINPGQGDLGQILKLGGGGLLAIIFGLLMLNGGIRTLRVRRVVIEDDGGQRNEKRGCSVILNGLGQSFFGVLFLAVGLGLISVVIYQEVLPWLGY